jgi:phytoene dehydrogenase-like protein
MTEKSIIVIGSGIAGLSAGCYGQMNGYHTRIFEQRDKPGGLWTSWERKGYTVDGCMYFLFGSGPGSNVYNIWRELGAVQGRRMVDFENFIRVEGADGKTLAIHSDIDRLERHLKELAPEDKKLIEGFIEGVRTFNRYELPLEKAPELLTTIDKLKILFTRFPLLRAMWKWKGVSIQDFAARFKNPFMREAFYQTINMYNPDVPLMFMQLTVGASHLKSAGYPIGGALEFTRAIERRYLGLGGEVQYDSRVAEILVEDDRAVGIRLENGNEYRADYVISAADGYTTIFNMLDGRFINDKIRGHYEKLPLSPPVVHVALGIARSFKDAAPAAIIVYPFNKPITIAGKKQNWLSAFILDFDSTQVPKGKTLVRAVLQSDYAYWKSMEESRYNAEKKKVADAVVGLLDQYLPGLAASVEMCDVATPVTYERKTSNWKGSILGWAPTAKTFLAPMGRTLPGLKNFYMAGQWIEPGGGVPFAAISGRNALQHLCKQDKKSFMTSIP